MESTSSEQGARPKTFPTGGGSIDYGAFRLKLESFLTREDAVKLATLFEYPRGTIDKIEESRSPSRELVQFMDKRGDISPADNSKLFKALKHETVGLGGVAVKLEEFRINETMVHSTPAMNEKKTQFLKELRNTYNNLCGEIRPAPFLRDEYDIEQLFIESGIEVLEEKQEASKKQEKWTDLKKYQTVFTDPVIKSKRRIIDAEPGYGKSTLALQITHDWCKGKAPMNEFQILILLRLRQFRNVPTVYSAIKRFLLPKDSKLTEDDIEIILDSSSTVVLLDGYDEYPDRGKEDTDIELIIRGKMFLKHEVVLTTRTSCLPPKYSHDTKRFRLTGFDESTRDAYIRKVVARGCSDDVDKIRQLFKVNPIDLWEIPLFFAMIANIVKMSDTFRNLTTVTQFFRHIIKCFFSHEELKVTKVSRKDKTDHSKLDKIAFEALSGDAQQISWGKNKLMDKIGKNLYDEYVCIGILKEEESFDYDTLEYTTETRFFHKLFAEWYAAHYLAKVAKQPEMEFEPWKNAQSQSAHPSQVHQDANIENVLSLKNLNPKDVHYMYRYACGLNPMAALKIIEHLATDERYDRYTLLCIKEWGGDFNTIKKTVTLLCSRTIYFSDSDSLMFQKSTIDLIEFASDQQIRIACVRLRNCIDVGSDGNLRLKPSDVLLQDSDSIGELGIWEHGREVTAEETKNILQYSERCRGLKILWFTACLLPQYIEVTEDMSVLRSRHVTVVWDPGSGMYLLNLESGLWEEKFGQYTHQVITDEEYQEVVRDIRSWQRRRSIHQH